jgi:hypothetical protein
VQVFFGTVEATVVSVSYNQVVVLSPPAPFGGVDVVAAVTVKNIGSGVVSNGDVTFTYTPDMHITALANGTQSTDVPFTPVTIYGTGFQAPVFVTLAGTEAFVQSVSATEIVVMPALPPNCGGGSGAASVTNITTGETATGGNFTYVVVPMAVTAIVPQAAQTNDIVELDGTNLPAAVADAQVTFNGRAAFVQSVGAGFVKVQVPPGTVTTPPTCTPPNPVGTLQPVESAVVFVRDLASQCSVTAPMSFSYELPCVAPAP